jgi:hypothetical protein
MRYGKLFVCLCTATGCFAISEMPGPAYASSNSESFIYYGFTQSDLVGGDRSTFASGVGSVSATTAALREAYGTWAPSLGGQPNSLFMSGEAFSNVTDFTTGFTFLRNPEARITPWHTKNSQLSIALEQSNDGSYPARLRAIDSEFGSAPQQLLPDITAQLSTRASWGHFEVGGIARDLGFEKLNAWEIGTDRPKGNWAGWGVNVSGALNVVDKDQLIAGIVYGRGIANYMNDGGIDLAAGGTPTDPHAVAMPLYGISAFYDHSWTKEWSSAIGYSITKVDNAPLQAANAYRMGQYASINLLYSPGANLAIGGEALWGQRTDRAHNAGEDLRLQFSLKYSFGTKTED